MYKIQNISKQMMIMQRIKLFLRFHVKEEICFYLKSDHRYNEKLFRDMKGKNPNLHEPKSYSEKLLYLKENYRNPLQTLCSDKYYVNEYIKACGFSEILKKTYLITRDARTIDYDKLPDRFFMRCNHMSGFNFVVDKKCLGDKQQIGKFFNSLLSYNWYHHSREWNYKNIEPAVICEEVLKNSDGSPLIDYKFYCFSGVPKYVMVSVGEFEHKVRNHKFSIDKSSIDSNFKKKPTMKETEVVFPDNYEEMLNIVRKLCKPFPHVRVDLYNIDGRIVFGELTFYTNGGVINVYNEKYENEIGSWIELNKYQSDMIQSVI